MSDIDPSKALRFIAENAGEYAKAKANRVFIENALKSVKATLMAESEASTLGAKEYEAYASRDYKLQLEGLREAVETEERLRWLLLGAQMRIEVFKVESFNKRQELRNLDVPG